jgi:hypothetical protein
MTLCTSCGFTIDGPLHRDAGCTGTAEGPAGVDTRPITAPAVCEAVRCIRASRRIGALVRGQRPIHAECEDAEQAPAEIEIEWRAKGSDETRIMPLSEAVRRLGGYGVLDAAELRFRLERGDKLQTSFAWYERLHEPAELTGGRVPAHVPGAYPRLSCCGGETQLVDAGPAPTYLGVEL